MSKPVGSRNRAERPDAYPEGTEYRDTGCSLHPRCLTCPFPECRYVVGGPAVIRASQRAEDVARLHVEGESPDAIAAALGISKRQVLRILQQQREASRA